MGVFLFITALVMFKFFSSAITSRVSSLLPLLQPQLFEKQRSLKQQINENIKQKNSISPQNQYAKWTKLNRATESLGKDLAALQAEIDASSSSYKKVGSKLSLLVTITFFLLRFYYRDERMFYLPTNVFPSFFEIIMSLNLLKFVRNTLLLRFTFEHRGFLTINNWCLLFDVFLNQIWFIFDTLSKPDLIKPEEPQSLKKTKAK
jgi:hypothetical protein